MRLSAALVVIGMLGGPAWAAGTGSPELPRTGTGTTSETPAETGTPTPPAAEVQAAADVFGRLNRPSATAPAPFGTYAKGCLAGGQRLAETTPGWQAMRLGRNRNWGHPELLAFITRLSSRAKEIGWPRIYVGDIGQPRGGPMRSGHRSHQIGLDVDIWLRRPEERLLSRAERERISSHVVVAEDKVRLNSHWTSEHHRLIRAAAKDDAVARIFVNAAIKRALCEGERDAQGRIDAGWLRKIRPWHGHDAHFHVRLVCPAGSRTCREQAPPPPGTGCGAELARWFPKGEAAPAGSINRPDEEEQEEARTRSITATPARKTLTLDDLPAACRAVAADDAVALAELGPAGAGVAMPTVPVFFQERDTAHEGFVGSRYFWTPTLDRVAAANRGVALRIDGNLPPGLEFRDRGGGNALVSGTPTEDGSFTFTLVAHRRGQEHGRQTVSLSVIDLGGGGRPVTPSAGTGTGTAIATPTTPTPPATPPTGIVIARPTAPATPPTGVVIARPGPALATTPTSEVSLHHQVRDFLAEFTGDECFLANPVKVALSRINIEAFADDAAPFYEFDGAFKASVGIEANIGARMIMTPQCPTLKLVRTFPAPEPARILIDDRDRVIGTTQPFEIAVQGSALRFVTILMVDPDGRVADLSGYARRTGTEQRVRLVVPYPGPRLLLVLDSARPLRGTELLAPERLDDFFRMVLEDNLARNHDLRASLAYFVIRE